MAKLNMSEELGRLIRADDLSELGNATYRALTSCIQARDWVSAVPLAHYFLHELKTVHEIYTTWCRDMATWLCARHDGLDEPLLIRHTTSPWYEAHYQKAVGLEARDLFARLLVHDKAQALLAPVASKFLARIERREIEEALRWADELRERNQLYQDIYTDWCWSIMTYVSRTDGEEKVADLIRDTVGPWYKERYDRYFALPEEERLQLTVEGMRGHLCGPGRLGDVAILDEGDRWVISFDPCGSGGRMRRGDPAHGDPPRTDAPYNFGVSTRPHDWTWGQAGVCYYCAHCAIVNEQLAIDTYGHPIRVTEYPRDPGAPCRWIIYKDVDGIPEEYYTRVGRNKPRRRVVP